MTGPNAGNERIVATPGEVLAASVWGIGVAGLANVAVSGRPAEAPEPARLSRVDARLVDHCIHDCITWLQDNGQPEHAHRLRGLRVRFHAHAGIDDNCGEEVCACRYEPTLAERRAWMPGDGE